MLLGKEIMKRDRRKKTLKKSAVMSVNPHERRKVYRKKKKEPAKSNVTKKNKMYGILILIAVFVLAFLFFWFVLKDLFYK